MRYRAVWKSENLVHVKGFLRRLISAHPANTLAAANRRGSPISRER